MSELIVSRAGVEAGRSARLGLWSAALIAASFVVFTVCFVAIALRPPLFVWTNLADYAAYAGERSQLFQHLARASMLVFGPLLVVTVICVHDLVPPADRVFVRIAAAFASVFAALTGLHYFLQLTAVRFGVLHGELEGLGQVVQANPYSAVSAVNMLGWTLFLGLASLFLAPVFAGDRLARAVRWALIANGVCCLLGGVGYVLDIVWLVLVTVDFGMGAAVLAASVLMAVWFRRHDESYDASHDAIA